MNENEPHHDDELRRRLKEWRVPDAPERLQARVLATYRAGIWRRRLSWRALLTSSVRVPLPVAVGVTLLCAISLLAALRPARGGPGPAGPAVSAPPSPDPTGRQADDVPHKDLTGFEPTKEMKVTILYPGDAR